MNYYKYQNIRSIEEYKVLGTIELEKIKKKMDIKNKMVTEIPIFRNCEFDMYKLNENLDNFVDYLHQNEVDSKCKLKSNLSEFISQSHATYLAPAYNFNKYIDLLIDQNINNFNREKDKYSKSAKYLYTVHIHNIFISIKCLLDRLVPILSYYYNGLSLQTTFGRIENKKKPKGIMSLAVSSKDSDPLMSFIYDEYNIWIKRIIEPRDTVIHYNDMTSMYRFPADGREFPMHYDVKIFDDNGMDYDYDDGYYYKSLMKDVQKVYIFFDKIFEYLKGKKITYKKQHFNEIKDFDKYKSNNYSF